VLFLRKGKIIAVFIICFTIVIYGVFMINVGFTKSNNKTVSKSIFAVMQDDNNNVKLSYNALYGEINIFEQEENKLAIYLNLKPFDIRFGMGNRIFYINSSIFRHKNMVLNINK
jgi:acetyltransferase-like isoleucine patch superfamily enzyme